MKFASLDQSSLDRVERLSRLALPLSDESTIEQILPEPWILAQVDDHARLAPSLVYQELYASHTVTSSGSMPHVTAACHTRVRITRTLGGRGERTRVQRSVPM